MVRAVSLLIDEDFGQRARPLRLETLSELRWLAVAGQLAAILIAAFALKVSFPLWAALVCVAASVALNLWLRWRFPVSYRLDDDFATHLLAYDILQLAILLFVAGGLANPFSLFFLAPLATSAVSLPWRNTLLLLSLALVCAGALEFTSLPLTGADGRALTLPPTLSLGLWFAISLSAIFVTIYGSRVASEARQLSSALNATELILARAQHLTQLDGLAAAAAHELGTPLATVALVLHEIAADKRVAAVCAEDLELAEEQIARCRQILGKLSSPAEMAAHTIGETTLSDLLEEIVAPHRLQDIDIEVAISDGKAPPVCRRNPAILYGLANLLENAIGFAAQRVEVTATWTADEVDIVIADDGPGFPPQVLQHLGEPYISDRAAARRGEDEPAGGLGLGLFIAKALLERSGARLEISNAPEPGRGAITRVRWPRATFDPPSAQKRHEPVAGEARQGADR